MALERRVGKFKITSRNPCTRSFEAYLKDYQAGFKAEDLPSRRRCAAECICSCSLVVLGAGKDRQPLSMAPPTNSEPVAHARVCKCYIFSIQVTVSSSSEGRFYFMSISTLHRTAKTHSLATHLFSSHCVFTVLQDDTLFCSSMVPGICQHCRGTELGKGDRPHRHTDRCESGDC